MKCFATSPSIAAFFNLVLNVVFIFDYLCNCVVFFSFFFSRPFLKISNFLKTVRTIFIKFCTVILRPKGPCVLKGIKIFRLECEKHSQNKPKNSQKTAIFDFRFLKNCPYDSNENFLLSFYTIVWSYVCNSNKVV